MVRIISGPGALGVSVSPGELTFTPSWEHLATVAITTDTTQIDITGLDSVLAEDFMLIGEITVGAAQSLRMFVNANVTDADYISHGVSFTGTTVAAFTADRPDFMTLGAAGTAYFVTYLKRSVGTGKYQGVTTCNNQDTAKGTVLIHGSDADLAAKIDEINIVTPTADAIKKASIKVYGKVVQ